MSKIIQKRHIPIDRFSLAVLLCTILALGIILGIWWYYDQQIDHMEQQLRKAPDTVLVEH